MASYELRISDWSLDVCSSGLFFVGRLWPGRLPPREALALGGVLWLGGEFAFVVFNEATRVRLIDSVVHDRLVAMVGISMALTPLLLIGITRLLREMPARTGSTPRPAFDDITDHQPKGQVTGMGRLGDRETGGKGKGGTVRGDSGGRGV